MGDFRRERNDWRRFRQQMQTQRSLREDFVRAILAIHERYDTSIRENRFVTGGAIEIFGGAALRAAGIPVIHRGARSVRLDLFYEDDPERGFSVKSLLKSSTTRLVNVMGNTRPSPALWDHATLFLIPDGVVYADPLLRWWRTHPRAIRVQTDALQVSRSQIREFKDASPRWFLPLPLALPSGTADLRGVRTASASVAIDILKDLGGPLSRHVMNLWP